MRERRTAPRYRCQLPCVLRAGKKSYEAEVVNVSLSGLSIRMELALTQGDQVQVVIESAVAFSAIVWRASRTRSGFLIALMLSNECSAYGALVGRHTTRAPTPGAISTSPTKSAPPVPVPELWWRLRVKDGGGNRTRMIALAAPSREEAITRTLAEIGAGWEILEAVLAPRAREAVVSA